MVQTTLRRLARGRLPADWSLATLLSLVWLLFYNATFWHHAFESMWAPQPSRLWFFTSLALLVFYIQAAVLLMLPGRPAMRAVASVLFVVAAVAGHFIDRYGIVFDRDMIRNVMQTDAAEARDLVTGGLWVRVALLGVLPAVLVWRIRLPPRGIAAALRERAVFVGGGLIVVLLAVLPVSASYAVFLREYKPVRARLNPGAAVSALLSHAKEAATPAPPVPRDPGGVPWRVDPGGSPVSVNAARRRPLVLFLVVGETARAANFQLNGYARPTTPRLAARADIAYFPDADSCGTSTAVSVPCLFSHRGRARFSLSDARGETNLLDMLQRAGIAVEWRENNSGCKGVCARVPTLDFFNDRARAIDATGSDPSAVAALCESGHCYDEILNAGLARRLADVREDTLIVFHQAGSHGPAYHQRYPPGTAVFSPACSTSRLDACSRQSVVNAYDNTIRYTDAVLARQIELLEGAAGVDAALLYVSDHGESLGEQGVYLHGMPYDFAPREQKQVPMLLWLSPTLQRRSGVSMRCLRDAAVRGRQGHDAVFHTVFGLLGVRNAVFSPGHDLTAPCRAIRARLHATARVPSRTPS